jgi:uncharacterized RDD family membrane protein YckC
MPRGTPLRAQIALELRGDITERLQRGQSMDEIARQLGDPVVLAESYLAAVPLVASSFWWRAAAKLLDMATVMAAVVPFLGLILPLLFGAGVTGITGARALFAQALGMSVFTFSVSLPLYTVVAEYWMGCTCGKWLLGLRVVRESGARISLGQAFVRQLALVGQIFFIDMLFALFTEKHQRAFELASKTRVVRVKEA